jgi:LDH2 family malate/lactate/ureidoglycolate dehydrogenase
MERGELRHAVRAQLLRETALTVLLDAGHRFGQQRTMVATEWTMAHARQHGIAAAAVRRSIHMGRLGVIPTMQWSTLGRRQA